jgi:DNA-binding beta-propeller fold protein YncE
MERSRTRPLAALCALGALLSPPAASAAGARLFKSGPIQITADGRWVWAANQDNDSVSRIDTSSDEVLEVLLPEPAVKDSPRGLSVREDGSEVWVACHDSDRLYVLSGDGSLLDRIDLPWGSGPFSVALSRDQSLALVTLFRAEALAVIDVAGRRLSRILSPVYRSPMGICWTEDGRSAWITHTFADGEHPFLTQVRMGDPEPRVLTQMQVFAADPRQSSSLSAPYKVAEGGYLTTRGHPAQIPTAAGRREVWLPTQYNNITEDIYTPDSTVQSTVRRLDLDTLRILGGNNNKVILSALYVHENTNGGAYVGPGWNAGVAGPIDIGFSRDGATAYVLHELSGDLVVLPSATRNARPAGAPPLPEIDAGFRPTGLALSPVAETAYVYNLLSRDVSVIDLAAQREARRIPVAPRSGEPFSPALLQGARIFHSSSDPRISANSKAACASCHIGGEHDGRSWGFHRLPGLHGPREVPSLLGLGATLGPRDPATGWGQLHRSGDRDELQDFEHTFRGVNMGGTGFLGGDVQPELGPPNAGRSAELDALAEYIASLAPVMRSPYRQADGSLSEAAVRGATFFTGADRAARRGDAGCAACHVPETAFVDFKFHDVGQSRPSSERELNSRSPAWHVNTPTLVGAWTTPHYDGSASFAPSILRLLGDQASRARSARPHGTPDGLTGRQLADLAEFVLSIDGNTTAEEVRGARDRLPPRIVRAEATSLGRIDVWFNETVAKASVEATGNWRLERLGGGPVAVTGAVWDGRNGDRVTLSARLLAHAEYRLSVAGTILDAADAASGGVANALDPDDPANQRQISIGGTLTITLGGSGYENLTVPVHDTAMLGPGLSTWSHDSVWLFPVSGGPGVNTGFVRFEWRDALLEAAGIASAEQIVAASFAIRGEFGNAHPIEIRRVLKRWSDPPTGGDWNQNATGAPTWRDHSHPSGRWNSPGAAAAGGTGSSVADYDGAFDVAQQVDAAASVPAINGEAVFSGAMVTEAFRFWFDHPAVDYGYALRLAAGALGEAKFQKAESVLALHPPGLPQAGGLGQGGPVLTLTYDLSEVAVIRREKVVREGDVWRFFRGFEAPPSGWNRPDFDDGGWESGPTGIGYGDGDDNTVLTDMQCTQSGGTCTSGGYLAFFARHAFELADRETIESATLAVSYDDGFAFYLNGVEVGRVNLPAGEITHLTAATATVGDAPAEPDAVIAISVDLLVEGRNVLAASVHNASLSSSDASFIPELEVVRRTRPEPLSEFERGDCNGDGVSSNITDVVFLLAYSFLGGRQPPCLAACDANGDGNASGDVGDPVYMLVYRFLGGSAPPAPFPGCGPPSLPGDAALGCAAVPACGP